MPGPEGLRRAWGTGAAGRGAPGLIGDPGNNEGREAGGLIGPGSGLAFVWDKALLPATRFPQPNSGSQLGPSGALRGRLREGTCAAGGGAKGRRLSKTHSGPGASRGPGVSLQRTRGASAGTAYPSFAAALRGFPALPTAPPAAPGRCCPLVSASRSAGCRKPAASSQLSFLDVLTVRSGKKCPCSSNFRGIFSPKQPRISTLSTRDSIRTEKGASLPTPFLDCRFTVLPSQRSEAGKPEPTLPGLGQSLLRPLTRTLAEPLAEFSAAWGQLPPWKRRTWFSVLANESAHECFWAFGGPDTVNSTSTFTLPPSHHHWYSW
nr:uncharacterized protein LOC123276201 [Equus asinus]